MGLFDRFKKTATPEDKGLLEPTATPKIPKVRAPKVEKTAKELATERGEPWVDCVSIDLDPDNIGAGAFELDWNEFFIAKLVRSGYQGKDDAAIVDRWFQDVCRNVVLETFEQYEANNPRPLTGIQRKNLGDGLTEVS